MMMGAGVSVSRLEKMVLLTTNTGDFEAEVISTRFGQISMQKSNSISLPRGLLGMPDKRTFCITGFPNEKFHNFRLLQSLEDYSLSFITLPVDVKNNIIAEEDMLFACKELGIEPENLVTLLIVSVHRSPTKTTISVNARAPILIDSSLRLAAQYVFQTDKYKVQHFITA